MNYRIIADMSLDSHSEDSLADWRSVQQVVGICERTGLESR